MVDTEFLRAAPERFNTVIAYVDEGCPEWVAGIPWCQLLGVAGLVVFVTYCHGDDVDARSLRTVVTDAAREAGLPQLDSIALLAIPVRTYADLLLFLRPLDSDTSNQRAAADSKNR
ncbi:hypothetical protein [Streptomyces sp. N35]|uniref:hypothetical protein n=1 Tax=Streptomyces sp. N35 TaxID=2795730 RepID=UPI0018F7AB24|nr:hypothetical protein [Streptomyces sp. N35]